MGNPTVCGHSCLPPIDCFRNEEKGLIVKVLLAALGSWGWDPWTAELHRELRGQFPDEPEAPIPQSRGCSPWDWPWRPEVQVSLPLPPAELLTYACPDTTLRWTHWKLLGDLFAFALFNLKLFFLGCRQIKKQQQVEGSASSSLSKTSFLHFKMRFAP